MFLGKTPRIIRHEQAVVQTFDHTGNCNEDQRVIRKKVYFSQAEVIHINYLLGSKEY